MVVVYGLNCGLLIVRVTIAIISLQRYLRIIELLLKETFLADQSCQDFLLNVILLRLLLLALAAAMLTLLKVLTMML